MFQTISHISDLQPLVADKPEIRWQTLPNGVTVCCYMFQDGSTFNSTESLECRGIAFDRDGRVCSRPLHKFFNVGEKPHLMLEQVRQRTDIVGMFDKLDGSMVATAWVDGQLAWRSKKAFMTDVVKLTEQFLAQPENAHIKAFAADVASQGMTAIFELTHPLARIVVAQDKPQLRLLHVRDNVTGEYVLLDPDHAIHALVSMYNIERVRMYTGKSFDDFVAMLEGMSDQEGFVFQFANGDMVKLKCPWYLRLHHSVTFLRERDIARSALNEELDDLKAKLVEIGVDMVPVNEVEARLKASLLEIVQEIETVVAAASGMDRKAFAQAHKNHPFFGLIMSRFLGQEVPLKVWYERNRLRKEFSLRVLADGALADALEG